ncbi:MAG: ATP-binding protein [Promethearchaeia archaeon]|nr:MAG: ATP-binding protein [Candidatus Lokiarchaeia archaeon]
MEFKDRTKEVRDLLNKISSKQKQIIVIYGRRRIGKTALALHIAKNEKFIYYLAGETQNLDKFYNTCAKKVPEILDLKKDYQILFKYLRNKVNLIIIDEFQNLILEDREILNIFQYIIDILLQDSPLKLILLGSSISLMTKNVLDHSSPLYARKDVSLKLSPVKFYDLKAFFPNKSLEEIIEIYGFSDGIPYYLNMIKGDFWDWLSTEFKSSTSFLKDEIDFIIRYEFKNARRYKQILEAIAFGKTTPNAIANHINLNTSQISKYLSQLIEIEFIHREIPITDKIPSRNGRYFLKDNFLRFWFRYIYGNLSSLEEGILSIDEIKTDYSDYLGHIFEKVAKQFLIKMDLFKFSKIGRWWWKENEIDLVAFSPTSKNDYLIECKWKEKVNAKRIVKELAKKGQLIRYPGKLHTKEHTFVVFARSFSQKIEEFNEREVFCFDLKGMEKILWKNLV